MTWLFHVQMGEQPHIQTHSLSLNPWGQISQPWPLELIERFLHQTLEAAALFRHPCVRVKKLRRRGLGVGGGEGWYSLDEYFR